MLHECRHTLGYGTEIVVVHLLIFRRGMSHQRPAREQQVGAGRVETLVNEEILLLPAQIGDYLLHVRIEILCHVRSRLVDGTQGLQQRCLIVKGLTRVGYEDGGNHQRVANDEDRRRGIPGRIAACLKGGAYAAGGERRGVRLLLHQRLAGKILYHAALAVIF